MILPNKREPSVTSPEIQEDVSRDAIAAAFQNAMASHLRSHVPGTNINEETFLASDYLNQFHELVMLLEALPVDPSTFGPDLQRWQAVGYEEHFSRSALSNKDLAIAAYRRAPDVTRRRIYLETMQEIYPKVNKKLLLSEELQGVLPLLQLESGGGAK